MDKLKMQSPNLVDANIAKIAAMFPNCITEGRDESGKIRRAVDFDQLRQELSAVLVEGPRERYTLSWPGKNEAILTANAPIAKTLRPCEEESVDFENTRNLYVEGDNLDVLKLLQETYLNTVKVISIDQPYNTGNDFIYEDDFAEDTETFLKRSNQKDEQGHRLVANTESNGRFHSDWLTMMYPRLKLARNLLKDDGVIFMHIDGRELDNLTKLCSEIFGEKNHLGCFIWRKKEGGGMADAYFVTEHEYVLVFQKSNSFEWRDEITHVEESDFINEDEHGKYNLVKLAKWGNTARREDRPSMYFPINDPQGNDNLPIAPDGSEGRWRVGKDRMQVLIDNGLIEFQDRNGRCIPYEKIYFDKTRVKVNKTRSILFDIGGTGVGTNELTYLFGRKDVFDNPKPTAILRTIAKYNTKQDDIILDIFSGSATTADATMQLNAEDGGTRKFIMVQLPEPCDEKSEAFKAGFKTIAEIGKERIRRAGKKIKEENATTAPNLDIGFRVFKVDTSNMKDMCITRRTN
jgi:adenine-specific DNA-methyltransferase